MRNGIPILEGLTARWREVRKMPLRLYDNQYDRMSVSAVIKESTRVPASPGRGLRESFLKDEMLSSILKRCKTSK